MKRLLATIATIASISAITSQAMASAPAKFPFVRQYVTSTVKSGQTLYSLPVNVHGHILTGGITDNRKGAKPSDTKLELFRSADRGKHWTDVGPAINGSFARNPAVGKFDGGLYKVRIKNTGKGSAKFSVDLFGHFAFRPVYVATPLAADQTRKTEPTATDGALQVRANIPANCTLRIQIWKNSAGKNTSVGAPIVLNQSGSNNWDIGILGYYETHTLYFAELTPTCANVSNIVITGRVGNPFS